MAYQKQTFINNETVLTAEMLDHIEQGIVDNETEIAKKQPKGDYVTTANLQTATDNALAQAKESGQFDGEDGTSVYIKQVIENTNDGGTNTVTFSDGTTLNIKNGKKGSAGADGVSPTVTTSKSGKVTTISITDKNGTKTATINDGADGASGKDGTSVTVSNVTTSTADGGSNVVTFSDGKTLTVKNGSKGSTGSKGADGKTPVKGTDYFTEAEIAEIVEEAKPVKGIDYFDGEDGKDGVDGKDGTIQVEPLYAESLDWLKTNGDTSKVYILPDGFIYAYTKTTVEVEGGGYKNLLPLATDTDRTTIFGGDYNGDGVNDGYITKYRLSSSGSISSTAAEDCRASGFISVSVGDVLRIKGACGVQGISTYLIAYNSTNTKTGYKTFSTGPEVVDNALFDTLRKYRASSDWNTIDDETNIIEIPLTTANFGTEFNAIRFSGYMDENTIVTVNEEIKEGGGTTTQIVEKWASTGHAFVPADYGEEVANLKKVTDTHTAEIEALKKGVGNNTSSTLTDEEKLALIRNWDRPIYESLTPFLLDEDLDIDTTYPKTYTDSQDPDGALRRQNVQAVYDEYNALCTAHPDFVRDITNVEHGLEDATETTFGGLCSDGVQYVRVYEFCEREGRHSNTTNADYWSETKPTFVIVTGIHWEYNGVYSMLNALKLITENPELRDMRRNCRFIVIPMSNPYSFTSYSNSGGGHYNANGVEIHNNFSVDFNNVIDSTHGTAPLSEVETRYIDNAMRKYADTGVCLLTCHSNATKGSNFIWGSVATKFMCNVSMRLVDLMSYAWDSKYDNYRTAIDTQKVGNSNPQEDGDYRCGFASLSTSTGTETKQALWYGMQGINVEVYERFYLFDPDGTDMPLAVSRGAEVYVNLLRLLAVTYDHNDRDKYAPSPAYKSE